MRGLSLVAKTFLNIGGSRTEGFLRFKDCLSNSLIHSPNGERRSKNPTNLADVLYVVPVKGLPLRLLLCCGVNSPAAVERRVGNLICDPGEIRDLTDKGEKEREES